MRAELHGFCTGNGHAIDTQAGGIGRAVLPHMIEPEEVSLASRSSVIIRTDASTSFLLLMLCLAFLGQVISGCGSTAVDNSGPTHDWRHYGGDQGGMRYSPLTQIDAHNVGELEVAWMYRHGDFSDGSGEYNRTSFQATPLAVEDKIYFCTGFNRVIALDAETGEERWAFDPGLQAKRGEGPYPLTCRGVAYWESTEGGEGTCERRIYTGTRDSELIALDAETGGHGDAVTRGGRSVSGCRGNKASGNILWDLKRGNQLG
jgi:glucose dehydrogenase